MQNIDQKELPPDSATFRTWWVKLPLVEAGTVQHDIKTALGWSRHVWHSRIWGHSNLTTAEKLHLKTTYHLIFE